MRAATPSNASNPLIRGVAGIGPLLFLAIATVEGCVRDGYDPIAQPISALALGERGWIQTINFAILAVSLLAMAALLRNALRGARSSRLAPSGFVVMAIGIALAGIFAMDPPGGPPTRAGEIHMAAGFLVFPWLPLVVLWVAHQFRRDAHWRSYWIGTLATGLFCLAAIIVFLTFVGPPGFSRPYPGLVGLVQRLELFPFLVWMAFVAHRVETIVACDAFIAAEG